MRLRARTVALAGVAAIATLMWPGPASGSGTSLGGYTGLAQAQAVRIEIFEPTIPVPATPQVDGGLGYTKASTDTGPVSRGTASYLWPGDTLGDGFGTLTGNDKQKYPVQVNSRYPATADSPAHNTAQVTKGNGMTTSSRASTTTATVTGLGLAGPDTDPTSGIGTGLGQLGGQSTAPSAPKTPAPVPVSGKLAAVATVANVKSSSVVTLGAKKVTATAHSSVSGISLLAGLISIKGVDITSSTVSDGRASSAAGHATVSGVSIAGKAVAYDERGLNLAGKGAKAPSLPDPASTTLKQLGISFAPTHTKRSAKGATSALSAQGLTVTVNTGPLKSGLNGPLASVVDALPAQAKSQLNVLVDLGPKLVISLGDVTSSATASPAYTGSLTTGGGNLGSGPTAGTSLPATTGGTGGGGGAVGGDAGGGSVGGAAAAGPADTGAATGGAATSTQVQSAGYDLPGLGAVPKLLILGALVFALGIGWVLRSAGGFVLGGTRNCAFGLSTGVPDLRKD